MLKPYDTPEDEPVAPECRATADLIQRVLDGAAVDALGADAHAPACPMCRERVRAARVLLAVLAAPPESVPASAGFADRVLAAVDADRRAHARGRTYKAAAWLALAAAVLVGVWFVAKPTPTGEVVVIPQPAGPEPGTKAPTVPEPAPEPRPIRVSDAIAKTERAILDTPNPLAESVAVAPKLFDALSDSFKLPAPPADPMATALEPARKTLADLPVAARTGLEPVTDTAEKAFNRFLRDMGSVKPNS